MAKFSGRGGALFVGVICALAAGSSPLAAQGALPAGWTHADIGAPVVAGGASSSGNTITVTGAGTDVGGRSDEFQYAYQAITGDADIRVRVASLQNIDPDAKAGLMFRESLNDNARQAFVFVSAGQGLGAQRRTRTGGTSTEDSGASSAAPVWLRLVRQGNNFKAYSSSTGASWSLIDSGTVNMATSAYVGLAVTSHLASRTAAAGFTDLALGSAAGSVPAPWASSDIGSPAVAGAASESGGTFTVRGAGIDIWDSSDQFRYVYQPITGDTQIVARVVSIQAVDVWSKAGVMIRATLTGPSAHASMFGSASNGWAFQRRLSTGGISYHTPGSGGAAPGWVRLVREGNLFSAYQSSNGSQWTLVGTETITMPSTVYVGLAISSTKASTAATATFTNTAVTTPTATNKPPTVSLTAPAAGASYTAPASVTLSATAGDVDGAVSRVDFYSGDQIVGSDSTSPFSVVWSSVPAGSYSVKAVATDNSGDTAASETVAVSVAAATNKPPTVALTAPAAGASYTAPASVTLTATAADADGSIARVEFYAGATRVGSDSSSPFSASWTNVAAGTYALTAVAFDNAGGKTTSTTVTVTVKTASTPKPTKVVFVPPTDYTGNVTSCTIELRRAADAVTVTPIASRNLGKPAVTAGEVTVDISTLVDPLAAGSYYGVIVTTGPGGSTRSSPSAPFTK